MRQQTPLTNEVMQYISIGSKRGLVWEKKNLGKHSDSKGLASMKGKKTVCTQRQKGEIDQFNAEPSKI